MISSISSSISARLLALVPVLAALLLLAGCGAGAEALRSEPEFFSKGYRIAVLPVDNLSGAGAVQAKQLRQSLLAMLEEEGFDLLEDERLAEFMARHRLRYVGGVDTPTSKALLKETGSNAVLVINLEAYHDGDPPKTALFCRLVSTGETPSIIWMDGTALAGDDAPGLLDLGLVHDHQELRDKALRSMVDSLVEQLSGVAEPRGKAPSAFAPKISFDASHLKRGKRYSIGVLPFIDMSERKHAGEILALQVVRQLSQRDDFAVLEPGVIREKMLNSRIIMKEGISKSDLDVLSLSLGSDLMLAGKVLSYHDLNVAGGNPKVEFSALMMEGTKKRIVWSSASYNQGDDRVFFFGLGRMSSAQEVSATMVRALLSRIKRSDAPVEPEIPEEVIRMERFKEMRQ